MKYFSLDIETTGLDPERDQVLSVAIVAEDTEATLEPVENLPYWECLINHPRILGDPFALNMNAGIIAALAGTRKDAFETSYDGRSVPVCKDLTKALTRAQVFFETHDKAKKNVVAGKNVAGFDLKFFPGWFCKLLAYRTIDVGNVAMGTNCDWWSAKAPPSMKDLLKRDPAHTALGDARDVVTLLRETTGNYGRVGS